MSSVHRSLNFLFLHFLFFSFVSFEYPGREDSFVSVAFPLNKACHHNFNLKMRVGLGNITVDVLQQLWVLQPEWQLLRLLLELWHNLDSQVDIIEREMRQINAFLRHVQDWKDIDGLEKVKLLACEAHDVYETFMIKRRKERPLSFIGYQFKVDKEFTRIMKELAAISYLFREKSYARSNTSDEAGTSSGVNILEAKQEVAQTANQLHDILKENFLICAVKKKVEGARLEFETMHEVLSNLESTAEQSKRQRILVNQVNEVCKKTKEGIGKFTERRKGFHVMSRLLSERKFGTQMEFSKFRMQVACDRQWTYGIGEFVNRWKRIGLINLEEIPTLENTLDLFSPGYVISFDLDFLSELQVFGTTWWRDPLDESLEYIESELELMHALSEDARSVEGLNERQKVWVKQVEDLASHTRGFLDEYRNRRGRYFTRLVQKVVNRTQFSQDVHRILHKIADISKRKQTYGITTIGGRKVTVHSDQNMNESSISHSAEITEEGQPRASEATDQYQPVSWFREEVKSIQEHVELMRALVTDVEEMEELDERAKKDWVEQITRTINDTQHFGDASDSRLGRLKNGFLEIFGHVIQKGRVERIRKNIKKALRGKLHALEQLKTQADSFSTVQRLRQMTQPSLVVNESSINRFDHDVEVLKAQLLSDETRLCVTSVVGIAGTGKTSLAERICDDNDIKKKFHCCGPVSSESDYATIQWLAKKKVEFEDKRYLIVVDNVQTSQFWNTLKTIIPDKSKGSRVLLFSCNIHVALDNTGPRSFFYALQLLDDEDSWALFNKSLKVAMPNNQVRKVGQDIVLKCGGLPSEIIKSGEELSKKHATKEEWSMELQQLKTNREPWLGSLDTMPVHLLRCLFYFVLFPKDYEIPARRLIVLWVAEGLVHHRYHSKESPEYVAETYLTQLIDLNMVQVTKRRDSGKVKTCRLPDALQELCLKKAKDYKFTHSDVSPSTSVHRLADHLDRNDDSYSHIHGVDRSPSASLRKFYKDVLSFLSFDTQEGSKPGQDIGNFLKRCISIQCFIKLRVLDLEHVYKPKLPKDIGKLYRLSYLGLRWTYLESLPSSISKLLRLQMLDLKHTYISTLPSSIWEMELRHLYLSETYRSRFPARQRHGSLESLTDLQTLWGLFVDEKCPLKGGLDRLVNLKKLGLACQSMSSQQQAMESQLEAIADWLLRLKDLQSLRLKSRDKLGRPWNLHLKSLSHHKHLTEMYLLGKLNYNWSTGSLFPPSLVELTLSHSGLSEDPMQILNDLPNLQSLHLHSESYIGKNMLCKSGNFPQLRVLKIWKLEKLEEWKIEQGALPSLRQLEIRLCECLKTLPDGLQYVTLLELKFTNMPMQFKNKIKNNSSEDWHKVKHIPKVFYDDSP